MTDQRIERVARALCAVDGVDPDAARRTGQRLVERTGNSIAQVDETKPEWEFRTEEARRFAAAFDALKAGE